MMFSKTNAMKVVTLGALTGAWLLSTGCKPSRAEADDTAATASAAEPTQTADAASSAAEPAATAQASAAPDEEVDAAEDEAPLPVPVEPPRFIVNRAAGVRFAAPPAYKETRSGNWVVYVPDDKSVMVAMTTFTKPNEATAKLGTVAQALGVSNVEWGQPKEKKLGRGKLPARVAIGKVSGRDAALSYATINPGGTTQLLWVYLLKPGASKERRDEVKRILASLERM